MAYTVVLVEKGLSKNFEAVFVLPQQQEEFDQFVARCVNCTFSFEKVESLEDAEMLISIAKELQYNRWSPNQDSEEREENALRAEELERRRSELIMKY